MFKIALIRELLAAFDACGCHAFRLFLLAELSGLFCFCFLAFRASDRSELYLSHLPVKFIAAFFASENRC